MVVDRALEGVEAVVHLAAVVGVGQSMYQIGEYTDVNNMGTAVLLEQLSNRRLRKLVVASSMSVYGEGRYRGSNGHLHDDCQRTLDDLRLGRWEPMALHGNGASLAPVPTPEDKPPALSSVYALSKFHQERLALIWGRAYATPTVALRFFNAYGPRQALSNPYTGVLAIFAARLINGKPPVIFEDGLQQRDFVSVHDVARACRLALESDRADFQTINVGSGQAVTILEIARRLAALFGRADLSPEITGKHRMGDIRHCFADLTRARALLGFAPRVSLAEGLAELGEWLKDEAAEDRCESARHELDVRGLTV
jgi:dTDP-L-rhamnose 4-epimerase